jgi:hypothetical protein
MFPINTTMDIIALCIVGGVSVALVLLAFKVS